MKDMPGSLEVLIFSHVFTQTHNKLFLRPALLANHDHYISNHFKQCSIWSVRIFLVLKSTLNMLKCMK